MQRTRIAVAVLAAALFTFASVHAQDVSGTWTAAFDTQIGQQQYTYEFVVKGTTLTGTAKGNLTGESKISDGKVEGGKISFVENARFQDMELRIEYSGTITNASEIKLSRKIADIATEELVAKRAK